MQLVRDNSEEAPQMRIKTASPAYIPYQIEGEWPRTVLLGRWYVLFDCGHQTALIGTQAPRPGNEAICWRCVRELQFPLGEKKVD